jgi:hypothetical protein
MQKRAKLVQHWSRRHDRERPSAARLRTEAAERPADGRRRCLAEDHDEGKVRILRPRRRSPALIFSEANPV